MRKNWFCSIAGCLICFLLLVGRATDAAAQSSKANLRVTANVVTSTAIIFKADGTAVIITANGSDSTPITTLNEIVVPGQASALGSALAQTFTANSPVSVQGKAVGSTARHKVSDRKFRGYVGPLERRSKTKVQQ